MATVNCPHRHRWVTVLHQGRLVVENRDVEILNGICDSCDRCGFRECEYFDDTPEATRRFMRAQALLHGDLKFREQDKQDAIRLRERHRTLYGTGKAG